MINSVIISQSSSSFTNLFAFSCSNNSLYALKRELSDQSLTLVGINPQSGNLTTISNMHFGNGTIGNPAIDPLNNRYFFVSGNTLITLDLSSGDLLNSITIPNLGSTITNLFTFNCLDNTLYGINRSLLDQSLTLVKIDPITGILTRISDMPIAYGVTGDPAIDPLNNRFFFSSGNTLITADLITGNIISNVQLPQSNTSNVSLFSYIFNCCQITPNCGNFPWSGRN